jgi:peptidoglycan/xylan/chitin deacetylase (PgdA/CDA1 family)
MRLGIKIDVDTERGTRIGVPQLLTLLAELKISATFLFSLGPDNTGRAIKRIFRPGFLKKVARTNVVGNYGLGTLLNGVLWPGPHIAQRNKAILQLTHALGHEVGIHCYDHIRWQDGVQKMSKEEVFAEFQKAWDEFKKVFNYEAKTAGAAGWQANMYSLAAYDQANLLYASDARGVTPFFPRIDGYRFKTLQVPSTLPTLDELLGLPEYPLEKLSDFYLSQLRADHPNVMTTHAELEGMAYLNWFRSFLEKVLQQGVEIVTVATIAKHALSDEDKIPVCDFLQGEIPGRSGLLAVQGSTI